MAKITGSRKGLSDALRPIVGDPAYVRRVVIDIRADREVMVHVERFGDDHVIDVVRELAGVNIVYADRPQPAEPPQPELDRTEVEVTGG